MSLDSSSTLTLSSLLQTGLSNGDFFILGAAILYSLHVVRLGFWANTTTPLKLATSKSIVQAVLSTGLVSVLVGLAGATDSTLSHEGIAWFFLNSGVEIVGFFEKFSEKLAAGQISLDLLGKVGGAVVWSGVVGTAYVLYAQSFGQRTVKPSDANLIYSLQPIFTALVAYVLLGEQMDPSGFAGGALVLAAVFLVASNTAPTTNEQ